MENSFLGLFIFFQIHKFELWIVPTRHRPTRFGEAESGLVFYANTPESRSKLVDFGIVEHICWRTLVGASLSSESVYECHKTVLCVYKD